MSALVGDDIVKALAEKNLTKRLVITPLLDPKVQIGPGSVDLRLGTEFLEVNRARQTLIDPLGEESDVIDSSSSERRTYIPLGKGIVLHPNHFILGSTLEFIGMPNDLTGQVVSRSSWGRLGLLVATAVAVQPGYRGVLTLELVNTGSVPILLRAGSRVAQLQLWRAARSVSKPYTDKGKYIIPMGPETSRLVSEQDESANLRKISAKLDGENVTP